jgi:hypothetical protein
MQFARTIFSDSSTFNEKKKVENRLWPKSEFSWPKKLNHTGRWLGLQQVAHMQRLLALLALSPALLACAPAAVR